MRTGDLLITCTTSVKVLRELLAQFKLSIHSIPVCTATGGKPAALLRGIPGEEYYSDIQDILVRRDITAQFFPLKEVVVLHNDPSIPSSNEDLIKGLRAKELEE